MAGKRDKPEEIVLKLRQVEVLRGQGRSIADAIRQIGVTQNTCYRWRKESGHTTSSRTGPMTGDCSGRSTSSTSSRARRW